MSQYFHTGELSVFCEVMLKLHMSKAHGAAKAEWTFVINYFQFYSRPNIF